MRFNITVNCVCPGPTMTSRFMHTLNQRKQDEQNIINKKKVFAVSLNQMIYQK